jgi:hypothetical protein
VFLLSVCLILLSWKLLKPTQVIIFAYGVLLALRKVFIPVCDVVEVANNQNARELAETERYIVPHGSCESLVTSWLISNQK